MHMYHKAEMVINTLNTLISMGHRIITTRTIKVLNNIEKSDGTTTQFIWRNLEVLEKLGLIKLVKKAPMRRYELPKTPIILEEVLQKCQT